MMRADFPAAVPLRRLRQQIRRARARTIIGRKFGPLFRPSFSQQYPPVFREVPAGARPSLGGEYFPTTHVTRTSDGSLAPGSPDENRPSEVSRHAGRLVLQPGFT